jgi:hypothetical protein
MFADLPFFYLLNNGMDWDTYMNSSNSKRLIYSLVEVDPNISKSVLLFTL